MDTPRKYFGGQNVIDGSIRQLNAATFKEFVERYIDKYVPLHMTRQQFFDSTKDTQKRLKSVAYYVQTSFKEGVTARQDKHAEALQLACFDFDEGDTASRIFTAPMVVSDQLNGINFVIHTTASHTAEKPRVRLIVDIEPMPLSFHKHIKAYLGNLLGLPPEWEGKKESLVLTQPMYRPIGFTGEDSTRFSAVIASRTSGRSLTLDEINTDLIAETITTRRFSADFDNTNGEESIETAPPEGVTVEGVRSAIFKLDSDMEYYDWVKVAMSLRHQFRSEEDAEAAFDLFDEWSAQGTKYPGTEDVYRKWKSVHPLPYGRPPVTIRSLFKKAVDAGWDSSNMARSLFGAFDKWLARPWSFTALNQAYPMAVAAQPFRDRNQDHILCQKVQGRMREILGGSTPPTTHMLLSKLREEDVRVIDTDEMPEWLRPIVYVSGTNMFVDTRNLTRYTPEAFNRTFGKFLMPDEIPEGHNARPFALPADYATNVMKIQAVVEEHYDPRMAGTEAVFQNEFDGRLQLNTYIANYPDPEPAKAREAGEIFEKHMQLTIGDTLIENIYMDFLAFNVQRPGEKIIWAVLFQSPEGVGKGLIAEAMNAILGRFNTRVISNNVVTSQWNDWCLGAHLLFAEELHTSGQNRHVVANQLKELIANPRISVNKRNTTAYNATNVTNLVAFTNQEDAIFINDTDRRWFIIKSCLRSPARLRQLSDSGYFESVARLHKDLAPGFRAYMLDRKFCPEFKPNGRAIRTKYAEEMTSDVASPAVIALREIIADNDNALVGPEVIIASEVGRLIGTSFKVTTTLREMGYTSINKRFSHSKTGITGTMWVHRDYDLTMNGDPVDYIRARIDAFSLKNKLTV
jgi:hypothetical protein